MRRTRFVLFVTAILLSSCARDIISEQTAQGEISISLQAKDDHSITVPAKSTLDVVPDAAAFEVEIYTAAGVRLYRDTYRNTIGKTIHLNAGDYRLLAQYGDSLGVGFDVIYFAADQNFTVHGQTSETVEAVARMANVKAAVNFGANFDTYYPEHYAVLRHSDLRNTLKFDADETRAGFIPAGELTLEVYANIDGTWKYYRAPSEVFSPNDFVTFNLDVDAPTGDITVSISIDDSVETITKEVLIPGEATSAPAPQISMTGFDSNSTYTFIEGVDAVAQSDFLVLGGIAQCTLNITSDYLTALGLPSEVDLINASAELKAQFEAVGISWNRDLAGKRIGSVDFSGLSEKLTYDADNIFNATFSVTVTDSNGRSATSETYSIAQEPVIFTLSGSEMSVYAKRIEGLTVDLTSGSKDKLVLEYSTDQTNWTSVAVASESGTVLSYGTMTGLASNTPYYIRATYNNNATLTQTLSYTTEEAAQIENSDFEDWHEWTYYVNNSNLFGLGNDFYQSSYAAYPEGGTKYWDTNNSETTPGNRTNTNGEYKSFPTVSYMPGRTGGRCAQIMTIAISNSAISSTCPSPSTIAAGRLFTGEYGGVEEVSFPSRPDKMAFWYKHESYDSDSFKAYVYIKNGDTIIAEGTLTSSESKSAWTYAEIELTYSRTDLRAQTAHVEFVSGVDVKWTDTSTTVTYGGTKTSGVHRGSIFTVDDMEFIYE